jgi:hypothetical protein
MIEGATNAITMLIKFPMSLRDRRIPGIHFPTRNVEEYYLKLL